MSWISFDCFGTLADWHTGFDRLVRPWAGARTPELIKEYHEWERRLERQHPHLLYRQVLAGSLSGAAQAIGIPLTAVQTNALVDGWHTLPIFSDVEPALSQLRRAGHQLAVLTNCDDDLFARTQACFRQPFDIVITAQQVQSYKPGKRHFEEFARRTGATSSTWIHVACSWFHDIAPTSEMGIPNVWVDRDRTGENPGATTTRIASAAQLPETIQSLVHRARPGAG